VPGRIGSGVYYAGSWAHPTKITIEPSKNCLPQMPPLAMTNPGNELLTRIWTRQGVQLPPHATAGSAVGSAAAAFSAAIQPPTASTGTFNTLVQNSFAAALQLAVGTLP
jgi:hypothetical protein